MTWLLGASVLLGGILALSPTAERVEATMERFLDAEGLRCKGKV